MESYAYNAAIAKAGAVGSAGRQRGRQKIRQAL